MEQTTKKFNEILQGVNNNSYTLKFNATKFNKGVIETFLLDKEQLKQVKNIQKTLNNIASIVKIEYLNGTKTININGYDYNIYISNATKLTTTNFATILKDIDKSKQIEILQNVLLDYTKLKNINHFANGVVFSGVLTIVKQFIIKIVTQYNKQSNEQNAKNNK